MARLMADIPNEEHKYLKMCCAKIGISLKEFITQAVIEKVEQWEDKWTVEKLGKWDGPYEIEKRDGKSFAVFEDGTKEELVSSEKVWGKMELKNGTSDV